MNRPLTSLALAAGLASPLAAATIRVPQDQPTIQAALAASVTGDEVLIAAGTYFEAGLDPAGQQVTIRGEAGAPFTILDAQLNGRLFTVQNGEQAGLVFEGLTFRRGFVPGAEVGSAMLVAGSAAPVIRDCVFENGEGQSSGIFLADTARVTIENTEFRANASRAVHSDSSTANVVVIDGCRFSDHGGSVIDLGADDVAIRDCTFEFNKLQSADLFDCNATIERCIFRDNGTVSGGLGVSISMSGDQVALVDDCEFEDNLGQSLRLTGQSSGTAAVKDCRFLSNLHPVLSDAALSVGNVLITVEDCEFDGNIALGGFSGGAALVGGAPGSTIRNCRFTRNQSASQAGALQAHQSLRVENCLFQKNRAVTAAGAVLSVGNDTQFIQCSIIDNEVTHPSVPANGAAMSFAVAAQAVESCIIYDNAPLSLSDQGGSTPVVTYSNVEGGFPGIGNIDVDPLFSLSQPLEYHLTLASPCVDAGAPTANGSGTDLDGDPRKLGAAVDMGADEAAQQSFPGTAESFELHTLHEGESNPVLPVKTPAPGDLVHLMLTSPDGAFDGSPVVLFAQTRATGNSLGAPTFPGVDLDPFDPGFLLVFNSATLLPGFGGLVLGPGGFSFDLKTPGGLTGTSLHFQAAALSLDAANGGYAVSNAHEIVMP